MDFGTLTEEQLKAISEMKDDNFINKFATEDAQGENILDILDYLEFVAETSQTEKAIKELEKNIEKVKLGAPTKKLNAKNYKDKAMRCKVTQDFLNDNFQKYSKFMNNFTDELTKFDEIAKNYIQHKELIKEKVCDKFDSVRHVPAKVYQAAQWDWWML